MASTASSFATPAMLLWARKKANLSIEEVAKLDHLSAERLESWERDDSGASPSFAQLEKLAKRYNRPLMVFYLESPPIDFQIVKDFRVAPRGALRSFSPSLTAAIKSAQERQAWASEYLREEGFPEITVVGSVSANDDAAKVAENLRSILALPLADQTAAVSDSAAFGQWKRHCEKAGVFVFATSAVDTSEMQGFALPDQFAPTVVINSKYAYTAKTFTLIHEFVHILLGSTGVSGSPESEIAPFVGAAIERFCNQVAAETIVPRDDFLACVPKDWQSRDDEVIRTLARRYWVSRAVIAMRLVETGLASKKYYESKILSLLSSRPKQQSRVIPQHVKAMSRNGESFSRLALSAYHADDNHGAQLANLLNMRLQYLPKLEDTLSPMRIQRQYSEPT